MITSTLSKDRIIPQSIDGAIISKSDGSVSYQLPNNYNQNPLRPFVSAPANAKRFATLSSEGVSAPKALDSIMIENATVSGIALSLRVGQKDYLDQQIETIFWYADEEGKELLSIDRLQITIVVGSPQPYPRYWRENGEMSSVPANRLIVPLSLSDDSLASSFINMRYEDDIFRITVAPGQIPDGLDLDNCAYEYLVAAPANALCYSVGGRSSSIIYGEQEKRLGEYDKELTDVNARRDEFIMHNGQRVIPLGGPMLATSRKGHLLV